MATVKVYNMNGEETGTIELDDAVFGIVPNEHVVHMTVTQLLANKRQGTKSAKTRAEVRGGGAKPWRQKGTGRARQGSRRSPQWTGGGVIFAPKPRDFSFKVNKKIKRLALKSVLSAKVTGEKLVVLDELKINQIKTKEMRKVLNNLRLTNALVVMESNDKNVYLSARNIPDIDTAGVNTINVYNILKHDSLVLTKQAVMRIQEVYA